MFLGAIHARASVPPMPEQLTDRTLTIADAELDRDPIQHPPRLIRRGDAQDRDERDRRPASALRRAFRHCVAGTVVSYQGRQPFAAPNLTASGSA